ncbi:unnamed protein product, partial [Effrenium voratum]
MALPALRRVLVRRRGCRLFADFSSRFEEEEAISRQLRDDKSYGSKFLEDVTNTKLRRMAPGAKRAKALFDSAEHQTRKPSQGKPQFRVSATMLDESLHVQFGTLEKIIKEGTLFYTCKGTCGNVFMQYPTCDHQQEWLKKMSDSVNGELFYIFARDENHKEAEKAAHASREQEQAGRGTLLEPLHRQAFRTSISWLRPKETEEKRQRHLRHVAKEKELRAKQQVIREVRSEKQRQPSEEQNEEQNEERPESSEAAPTAAPTQDEGALVAAKLELAKVEEPLSPEEEALGPRSMLKRVSIARRRLGNTHVEKVDTLLALAKDKQEHPEAKLLAELDSELENLAPRQLSELLLLPRFDPKITAKLLRRVSRQASALDNRNLAAALLAIARLQASREQQVLAEAARAVAALEQAVRKRKFQQLQPLEAAALAVSCAKATVRHARSMRYFGTVLAQSMEEKFEPPTLGRKDLLACLRAFAATWCTECAFLTAAQKHLSGEGVELCLAVAPLPAEHKTPFAQVLQPAQSLTSLVKLASAAGSAGLLDEALRAEMAERLQWLIVEGADELSLRDLGGAMAALGPGHLAVDLLAKQAATAAKSSSRFQDVVDCAEAIAELPRTKAVSDLWQVLCSTCRHPSPSEALRFLAAMAATDTGEGAPHRTRPMSTLADAASRASPDDFCLSALQHWRGIEALLGRRLRRREVALSGDPLPAIRWLCQSDDKFSRRLLLPLLLKVLERAPTHCAVEALGLVARAPLPVHQAALRALREPQAQQALEDLWPELSAWEKPELVMAVGALGIQAASPAAVEPPGEEGASVVPETEELPEEAPVEETGPEQLGGAEEGPEELASGPDWSPNEESVAQQAAETERILAKLLEEPEEPEEPPKKRKKREDRPPEPKKPARKGWIVNRSTEASASDSDAWGNWRSPLTALA